MTNIHSKVASRPRAKVQGQGAYEVDAKQEWLAYEDGAGYPYGLEEDSAEDGAYSTVPSGLAKYGVQYLTARAAQMKHHVRLVMAEKSQPSRHERLISDRRNGADHEYSDQFMANLLLSTYERRTNFGRRADDLAPYMH